MSKREIRLGVSPLTETVYAGTLLKDGKTWGASKQDVTSDFIKCVLDKFGPSTPETNGCECGIQTDGGPVDFVVTVTRAAMPRYSQLRGINKELLEALINAVEDEPNACFAESARAVIAKAKGETA